MSLAKAFLAFKHEDPYSTQHYRERKLCRLIMNQLISSIENRNKNFSKHFKGK